MNVKLYYFFYVVAILAIIVGITKLVLLPDTNKAIPVVLAYPETNQGRASAVYIGDGYFLTVAHSIQKDQTRVVIETSIGQKSVAEVLWSAKDYDVSLLYSEFYSDINIQSYTLDCNKLSVGDELRFIGNPANLDFVTTWGRVAGNPITDTPLWKKVTPVNTTILLGMSGGAVIDNKDRLKGINVGTLTAATGFTPFGPQVSFTGFGYIVEASDICFLMGKK
jgi:serine protease Do